MTSEQGQHTLTADEVWVPGWTEERFFAEAPEQGFYELKDGKLIMHSAVNVDHQRMGGFRPREITEGVLESSALPGFSIQVEWLWERPLPNEMECLKEVL